jgi:uncharacterized protein
MPPSSETDCDGTGTAEVATVAQGSRLARLGAMLLLTTSFLPFLAPSRDWRWCTPCYLAAGAWLWRALPAWRGPALVWTALGAGVSAGVPWPLSLWIPVALVFVGRRWEPNLARLADALCWGRVRGTTLLLAVPIVLGSGAALVLWFRWATPDVSNATAMIPPSAGLPALIAGALVFSIANALWEELLAKWLVWESLTRLGRSAGFALCLQAVLFGLLHLHGFPSGWLGVSMAAGYGLVLGVLRLQSGGLLAVVVAHTFADLVICSLVFSQLG